VEVSVEGIVEGDVCDITAEVTGGTEVNAGTYTARATITLSNSNYRLPEDLTCTYVIKEKQSGSSGGSAVGDKSIPSVKSSGAKSNLVVKKTSYTKTMGAKSFNLNASADAALSYTSSNKKVATVSKNGKVTIKGCGIVTITVKASGKGYKTATKKVTIKVLPKKAVLKSVTRKKSGKLKVTWSRQKEADGYVVEYSTDKNFKKNTKKVVIKKNKTTSTTIKNLKKNKTYYVRVKAYTKINKKKVCGKASKVVKK
jgi:hypothetical protein